MRSGVEDQLIFHRGRLTRSMFSVRVVQILDLCFTLTAIALVARFVLEYAGVDVHGVVQQALDPASRMALPFQAIPTTTDPAGHPLAWSFVVALAVYGVVYRLLVAAVRRLARPKTDPDDE